MSRQKLKVSKLISGENDAERNRRLAQLGEFAEEPLFDKVFCWRFKAMLHAWSARQPKAETAARGRRKAAKLDKEIGQVTRQAILRGDWKFLERLAKITRFLEERFQWRADTIFAFGKLLTWEGLMPVDPLRTLIAQEYLFTWGIRVDKAKKSRKAFMQHIESRLPDAVCEKTFDRACRDLGIRWRQEVDNSRG